MKYLIILSVISYTTLYIFALRDLMDDLSRGIAVCYEKLNESTAAVLDTNDNEKYLQVGNPIVNDFYDCTFRESGYVNNDQINFSILKKALLKSPVNLICSHKTSTMKTLSIIWLIVIVRADILHFPDDFKFGVATAAYQIEGGWNASGKGENIWDRMTHQQPDKIKDGTNGDIACDSYNQWKTDVQLLKDTGVHFYRFSLSWSRLLPNPIQKNVNSDGVRYYNDLIDELLKNNIEPMVTLYHWDLPQILQDMGGWPNVAISDYFKEYADVAFRLFGDRVKMWLTFNEPNEVCLAGYGTGSNAPGIKASGYLDYQCGRTILLSHAKAYHLYNNTYRFHQKGKIGITLNSQWIESKTNLSVDHEASERAMQMELGWWAHPIFSKNGNYPRVMIERVSMMSKCQNLNKSRLPEFTSNEVEFIKNTSDFFGLNHYSNWLASNVDKINCSYVSSTNDKGVDKIQDPSWPPSAANWLKDVPWGFRKLLSWIKQEYNNPTVYVTENGFADLGELYDFGRIRYHQGYLNELLKAIHIDKCKVTAYTAWSIIDNMEWEDGYTLKFGLYYVNFSDPLRTRTPKLSAHFYKNIIKSRQLKNNQYK
ncbi:hypothetical protein RN001_014125 [Aquatica leii]|uniref:beta-glucosidase n=1 Tax=Aquatica leii TaxID=1421715 RepID=A0AAN7NX35_9COLE|nr:hypothetical protein RN001_014125 [Aquatica leii]